MVMGVRRGGRKTYIGIWISLTKYPMKPMTTNPIAMALHSWTYSASSAMAQVARAQEDERGNSSIKRTFLVGLGTPVDELFSVSLQLTIL